jgi:proline iminopeptidase
VHLTADGIRLFVETVGDGPPLLMLHGGLGMDHTYFRPDFDRLAPLRTVVYLDHRGNGRSDETEDPVTIGLLADDAADLLRSLGGRGVVVGHSFGGFVAQELAIRHPDVVERLVLLSTTPGQLGDADDLDADQGPPPPDELLAILSEMPSTDDEYAARMPYLFPFYMHGDPTLLAGRAARTVMRVRPMIEGFRSLATWSAVDRLGSLSMPVLIIAGDHDHFTAHQQAERIARLVRHAQLHVIRDAGHFPWLEHPDELFELLTAFLVTDAS